MPKGHFRPSTELRQTFAGASPFPSPTPRCDKAFLFSGFSVFATGLVLVFPNRLLQTGSSRPTTADHGSWRRVRHPSAQQPGSIRCPALGHDVDKPSSQDLEKVLVREVCKDALSGPSPCPGLPTFSSRRMLPCWASVPKARPSPMSDASG